jgi:hypothetical protein
LRFGGYDYRLCDERAPSREEWMLDELKGRSANEHNENSEGADRCPKDEWRHGCDGNEAIDELRGDEQDRTMKEVGAVANLPEHEERRSPKEPEDILTRSNAHERDPERRDHPQAFRRDERHRCPDCNDGHERRPSLLRDPRCNRALHRVGCEHAWVEPA